MENRFRIEAFIPPLKLHWVAQAIQARSSHPDITITGVTTDSRLVQKGDLFIALKGEHVDGHDHIEAAVASGATAIIGETELRCETASTDYLKVGDTLKALGDLAQAWRRQFDLPMLGITGSNGKTTTKEIVHTILSKCGPMLATWKNWNNLIGVPLTLCNLRKHHLYGVIEMGMNSFGEIRRLTQISRPNYRLITNIMPVHLQGVGDIEGVARAKGEILEEISPSDTFVINGDDPRITQLAATINCRKVSFREQAGADVHLTAVTDLNMDGYHGEISIAGKKHGFRLPLSGQHNLRNMLAAVAATHAMGIGAKTIVAALMEVQSFDMRSQWLHLADNIHIWNDCYNANPGSMRAALSSFKQFPGKRHIAVLGDMLELGQSAAAAHLEMLELAKALKCDLVFCLGEQFESSLHALKVSGWIRAYRDIMPLNQELGALLRNGDVVLIKGSRGMRLERCIEHLTNLFEKSEN